MREAPDSRNARRDHVAAFARFLWQRLRQDKCFETAGALSYTTLFAVVPMLAAVIAIISVFPAFSGLRGDVTRFIFRSFVPAAGETVQGYLLQFADNASRLTATGIIVLLLSALLMMASIEDRLNRIWRVPAKRKGSARLLLYWAALTLGPILVTAGIGVSSWVYAQPLWRGVAGHGVAGFRLWLLAPFLITWLGLTLLYEVVPNCRVRWRDALTGALVAAVLFEVARKGFALYVQGIANYREIYGALAAVPIFLIWIYLSWVIVLLGAILAAAKAAFEYRRADELLPHGAEFAGLLQVVQAFVAAQRAGQELREADLLEQQRFLTAGLLQRYLADLQAVGMVRRFDGSSWVVVRDLGSVSVDDLFRAGRYRLPGDAMALQRASAPLAPDARRVLQRAEAALRQNFNVSLRALFSEPSPVVALESGDRS
ncbi:MAG TPA: YihY family inner membrane protein [Rhodanobacteraceae bacterium]|nr:YihY family inner membrane protein [Rhodanobacteraceae bacterium]